MDLVPELNIIRLLTNLGSIGTVAAWMDHFIVGVVVWGLLFGAYDAVAARPAYWLKGIIFGIFAWLLMMVLFMPLAKQGFFGTKLGAMAPVVTLMYHLVYGVVLGVDVWAPDHLGPGQGPGSLARRPDPVKRRRAPQRPVRGLIVCCSGEARRPLIQGRRRLQPIPCADAPWIAGMRKGSVKRTTKETDVEVAVDLDGTGASSIATGIGFLDHMLDLLARHSRADITVKAKGDLHIDHHHTTEDVGIALGQAVKQALGDMKGITRYADVHLPMDEALTRVAIDISGRPFLVFKAEFVRDKVGTFDTELVQEWFQAFAMNAGVTLARRDALRHQRPSYCRILLQGSGAGLARRGCDRCARRERSSVDQRLARRIELIEKPAPDLYASRVYSTCDT